ncbi:MAG: hypothetical protein V7603_5004 [Micromonosporaceae bacterium]
MHRVGGVLEGGADQRRRDPVIATRGSSGVDGRVASTPLHSALCATLDFGKQWRLEPVGGMPAGFG